MAVRAFRTHGLSPRVRGNHFPVTGMYTESGSIPARAGEPFPGYGHVHRKWVYPRACGGTPALATGLVSSQGLSPRVRGNRAQVLLELRPVGSIPARAGEPVPSAVLPGVVGVYPRACGGTLEGDPLIFGCVGLSPRVRGNHGHRGLRQPRKGSIPARAGEPPGFAEGGLVTGVYPRACGGTSPTIDAHERSSGLSPRVRGNPKGSEAFGFEFGSIPARAGEPRGLIQAYGTAWVYPRACGGTTKCCGQL